MYTPPSLCGVVRDSDPEQPCRRREGHRGKHRTKRGATWANPGGRYVPRRYVPPHRRSEGEPARTGGRFKRSTVERTEGDY